MSTNDPKIRERAIYWAGRMDSPEPVSPAEREEWLHWMSENKAHEIEFREVNLTTNTMSELPAANQARLIAYASTDAVDAPADSSTSLRSTSRRQFLRWTALAASVLVVAGISAYFVHPEEWFGESYATRTGETRVVTFQEGSVAYLNTRSKVRWLSAGKERRVQLVEGEVLFDVVHDATHPFLVVMDHSEIRVLGTRFNVYRKPSGDTTITVIEGTVEVRGFAQSGDQGGAGPEWLRTIHANEQIEYRPIGLTREPHDTVALKAVKWRSGVMEFKDEPLMNVLDELTRYTDQRIVIRDPRLAQLPIGGQFSTRNVRGALARLEKVAAVEVTETNGTFTLDYRSGDGKNHKD
jgi:transmembrane sensor